MDSGYSARPASWAGVLPPRLPWDLIQLYQTAYMAVAWMRLRILLEKALVRRVYLRRLILIRGLNLLTDTF